MTVPYNADVATSRGLGNFILLSFRWRGSVYKLVYPYLILYLAIYFVISILYRFYFHHNEEMKKSFEHIVRYCKDYGGLVPVSFILGFYVSQIVTRWWNQWMICPWPDNLAILVATHLQGHGERSRLMRRTIMRYINLSFTLTMTLMSPQAQARFPTLDHFVEAGYLLQHEKLIIDHLNTKNTYLKYWIPLIWAGNLAIRARREGRINDDIALATIVKNICKFRNGCGDLLGFDWVNIPLVYNQVASLAVFLYFVSNLLGQQFIVNDVNSLDLVFPLFLFIEFFFYMGWLMVAQTMLNAWGEDDDDFEVNWMIDRNFCVSYVIVDEMHAEYPEMLKDQYWEDVVPEELPYTAATLKYKRQKTMKGSTYHKNLEKSMYTRKIPEKSMFTRKMPEKSMFTRKMPEKSMSTRKMPEKSMFTRKMPEKSIFDRKGPESIFSKKPRENSTKKEADKQTIQPVQYIATTSTANSGGESTMIIINFDESRVPTVEDTQEIVIAPNTYKNYMEASFVPMDQDETYTIPTTSTYPMPLPYSYDKSPLPSKHRSPTISRDNQLPPTDMNSKTNTENTGDQTKTSK